MVLGKFMPPHRGHQYLIDFARHYVDELAVVVETAPGQPIPGELRFQWVREMFPQARVIHLTDVNPQDPSEHPDFWQIWHDSLVRVLPWQPDYVFASEPYGTPLAQVLGATFIPVDLPRSTIPISGTAVRADPMRYWEDLPRLVRPYFARRVCVFGPESTGKSTLTKDLARHFQTVAVPEYARTHLETRPSPEEPLTADDFEKIARGQIASEDALALNANRVLICDTDLLLTTIWSDWLCGSCPDSIRQAAENRTYDLYLVTDVDVPWVADAVRYLPEERRTFFDRCLHELKLRNRPHVIIRGDWDERFQTAVQAIKEILLDRR